MYTVYIIYSQRIDKSYIGHSSNVQDRLLKHNRHSKGFSSIGIPWILIYSDHFDTKKDPLERESQLKKWKNRQMNISQNKSQVLTRLFSDK